MKKRLLTTGLLLLFVVESVFSQMEAKTILFICEHGSAKSIVAAAHFAKLARQEGLNVHVISRGINPDKSIPEAINSHLVEDGLERHDKAPMQLTKGDIANSDYVIAFNSLPETYRSAKNIENWNIPSFEAGYSIAKDSILLNIKTIIGKIKSDTQK
jgi:arsenate reductase (thioredoxin)